MSTFSELTNREKTVELVRWMCVLPAVAVGGLAAQYASGVLYRLAVQGWGAAAESNVTLSLQVVLRLLVETAAILAGAWVAPRNRLATALVLAVGGAILALFTHVLSQSHRGATNYLHFAAEAGGAAVAVACIYYAQKRRQRQTRPESSVDPGDQPDVRAR
ncbi:MAG: hypothetical protein HYX69_15645 [Planctomycetia bacterium]|nr:hypothetical protein [Planctomycetia bacterium]